VSILGYSQRFQFPLERDELPLTGEFLSQGLIKREAKRRRFKADVLKTELQKERSDAFYFLLIVDDPGPLDLLLCLCPIPGIAEKKGFSRGKDKGTVASSETAEIPDVFKAAEKDSIKVTGLPYRLSRRSSWFVESRGHHFLLSS
jgi:hypothetical protein